MTVPRLAPSHSTRLRQISALRARVTFGQYTGVTIGLIAVCVYMAITQPVFMTWANWQNIFRSEAIAFIASIGMTFVILTAGIDLSIGSATAGCAVAFGLAIQHGALWWVAALLAIGVGLAFGLFNGLLIGVAKIPFFVVTLGTLSIYQSVALLETDNGQTISLFDYGHFQPLQNLINGQVGSIPTVLIVVLAGYLLGALVLRYSTFGRAIYAVGSNREAARLSGVKITLVFVSVYALSGLSAGLAGVVQAGRLTAAAPQADPTLMLTVIAAVLLGGTSLSGGEGGLFGTFLGVLFLGTIQNALQLGNVSIFYQGLVSGGILILAVGLGVIRDHNLRARLRRWRARSGGGT